MTSARSVQHDPRGNGGYAAPANTVTVKLLDLLQSAQRGPNWATHQLDIFKSDASEPDEASLFCAGDVTLVRRPCVSVVGSREATPQGRARATRLVRELVEAGVVIVSGLAKGIDTAAHKTAIDGGGQTIAVIGTPLSKASPGENASLQEAIWRNHLLISPFGEGSQVHRANFPYRNRIMAAISDATVIVEADDNSGTLHQAVACQKIGRWLFILKTVVETKAWPRRFLNVKNTVILENTEQILHALDLR
ncbi:MAG: processing protein [Bradyrhizobium sp.]|nr:processing protein [Bradyrhizobium sp.]